MDPPPPSISYEAECDINLAPKRIGLGRADDKSPALSGPQRLWKRILPMEHAMMDVIVLGLGVVFFVATIAYAYACDRL